MNERRRIASTPARTATRRPRVGRCRARTRARVRWAATRRAAMVAPTVAAASARHRHPRTTRVRVVPRRMAIGGLRRSGHTSLRTRVRGRSHRCLFPRWRHFPFLRRCPRRRARYRYLSISSRCHCQRQRRFCRVLRCLGCRLRNFGMRRFTCPRYRLWAFRKLVRDPARSPQEEVCHQVLRQTPDP